MFNVVRTNSGSAVILILAAVVVLGAAVETGIQNFLASKNQVLENRVSSTYTALSGQLSNGAVQFWNGGTFKPLAATLRTSATLVPSDPANQALINCVIGSTAGSCQDGVEQPVALYFPVVQNGTQPELAGPGPYGPQATPARYDVYGNRCSSATWTPRCPFEVYAQFTPSCGGPAACNRATSLTVHLQLRGPKSEAALLSGQNLPVLDIVSSPIDVNAILPPTPVQAQLNASTNVQVLQLSGSSANNTTADATPPSEYATIDEFLQALRASGVTNVDILNAFANSWYDSIAEAQAVANAIVSAGITDATAMGVMVNGDFHNSTDVQAYAGILKLTGIQTSDQSNQITLAVLLGAGVSDPATLSAMYNQILAVNRAGDWDLASRVATAGVTTSSQMTVLLAQMATEAQAQSQATTQPTTSTSTTATVVSTTTAPPPITMIQTCAGSQCQQLNF